MNEVGRFEVRTGGLSGRPRCKFSRQCSVSRITFHQEVAQEVVEDNLGTAKAIIHQVYVQRHCFNQWKQVALDTLEATWVPQVNEALGPLHFRVRPYLVQTNKLSGGDGKWNDQGYYHPRYGPGINYDVEPHYRLVIGLWRSDLQVKPAPVAASVRVSIPSRALDSPSPPPSTYHSLASPSYSLASPTYSVLFDDIDEDDLVDEDIDNDQSDMQDSVDETATTADMTWSLEDHEEPDEDQDNKPLVVMLTTTAMGTAPPKNRDDLDQHQGSLQSSARDLLKTVKVEEALVVTPPPRKSKSNASIGNVPFQRHTIGSKGTTKQNKKSVIPENCLAEKTARSKPKYLWDAPPPSNTQYEFCEALPGWFDLVDKDGSQESLQGTLATMDMSVASSHDSWSFALAARSSLDGILAKM